MEQQNSYRFRFQDEQAWRKHLADEGFVVIAHWLTEQQCQLYVQAFWSIMQTLADGKLDRNDVATQTIGNNYPPVLNGGMIQYVGHSRPQWDLRKRVKPLFSKLWQTQNLKSSFDGFCFMNGLRNYKHAPINANLHCDQAPIKDHLWSYQGVMALTNSGQHEGGFVCLPRSHKFHQQYFADKGLSKVTKHWYAFSEEEKEKELFNQCLKLNTKAGDFTLWDSRTFHCNTVPTEPKLRVCTYICMLPANHVPPNTQVLRQLGVKNRRTSNHHPGDGFKTFSALPRSLKNTARFEQLLQQINNTPLDEQIQSMI